jgi:pantoate--beta-alanine ligase
VITITRVSELREWCDAERRAGRRIGFVPTMGYFHEGHLSLMRAARAADAAVVVSLFVNPTQFAPSEDLAAYPRDPEGDARAAEAAGVDVLFVPPVEEMYPQPMVTSVRVSELADGLCGASRPHHFGGVATVVTKLFAIVGPCRAYFGKKDYQQLRVVSRLVDDLNLPVEVVGIPTTRELDGLAMSSRNAYLSPAERPAATVLYRALEVALKTIMSGERNASAVRDTVVDLVGSEPLVRLDYAELVTADDLRPVDHIDDGVGYVVALAAFVGSTRLIDNATFRVDGTEMTFDLPGFGRPSLGS